MVKSSLMLKTLFFLFVPIFAFSSEKTWVAWDSTEGQHRFESCSLTPIFWKLTRFYESQTNLTYCGIASAVIALNALGVHPPKSKHLGEFTLFTQEEFFTPQVLSVIQQEQVDTFGVSLLDLTKILQTFLLKVQSYEAIGREHHVMRSILQAALTQPNQCILASYSRPALEQIGQAHWSPVAAYDATSDSFLVLDVARFKYPPVWIAASALFNAMQTTTPKGKSRGFIIIETPSNKNQEL